MKKRPHWSQSCLGPFPPSLHLLFLILFTPVAFLLLFFFFPFLNAFTIDPLPHHPLSHCQTSFVSLIPLPTLSILTQHVVLELLGTHDDYQGHGLGSSMLEWGCSKADSESLETYLDASEKGQPFYKKHFAFKHGKNIAIPDKEAYGTFTCISLVRPVQVKDAK